jgi:hypothetical protein
MMRESKLSIGIWVPGRLPVFSDGLGRALAELGAGNALTDMKKDRHEKNAATWLVKQGPPYSPDQGIVRDKQGQEQPRDKARAQQADQMNSVRR